MNERLLYSKSALAAKDATIAEYQAMVECFRTTRLRKPGKISDLLFETIATGDPIAAGGLTHVGGRLWRSTSRDPKFLVPIEVCSSYLQVLFSARIIGLRHEVLESQSQLFLDYGHGYSEACSQSVFFRGSTIVAEFFVKLEGPILQLRLDPVDRACDIEVCKFEVVAWGVRPETLRRTSPDDRRARLAQQPMLRPEPHCEDPYRRWVDERAVDAHRRQQFIGKAADLESAPLFSILMPVLEFRPDHLESAIRSVLEQTYPAWELWLVATKPGKQAVEDVVARATGPDGRVKVCTLETSGGMAEATNAALARASGAWVVLVDRHDEIAPHALFALATAIGAHPGADWLYSDEDEIGDDGTRCNPFFKPDWSPTFLLSCMYARRLGAYRRTLLQALKGFRAAFDAVRDYDLALRLASVTPTSVHVADVLYHARRSDAGPDPEERAQAIRAVEDFVAKAGFDGQVDENVRSGTWKATFAVRGHPMVTILIPTAGRPKAAPAPAGYYVLDLVESIRQKANYPHYEIIVIHDHDLDRILVERFAELNVRLLRNESLPFSYCQTVNLGAEVAVGDYIVLIDDDTEVIDAGWLRAMLSWCQLPHIAVVGAKLLYPNDLVQHAGVVLYDQGPSHIYNASPASDAGYFGSAATAREYSAVTSACMMVRRSDYRAIGGFDESYRTNYADIDFCLRITAYNGGRVIFCPDALLYHREASSKSDNPPAELEKFNRDWADRLGVDPYHSPHLSQTTSSCQMARSVLSLERQYGLLDTETSTRFSQDKKIDGGWSDARSS